MVGVSPNQDCWPSLPGCPPGLCACRASRPAVSFRVEGPSFRAHPSTASPYSTAGESAQLSGEYPANFVHLSLHQAAHIRPIRYLLRQSSHQL